jgi:hypothetical protein
MLYPLSYGGSGVRNATGEGPTWGAWLGGGQATLRHATDGMTASELGRRRRADAPPTRGHARCGFKLSRRGI